MKNVPDKFKGIDLVKLGKLLIQFQFGDNGDGRYNDVVFLIRYMRMNNIDRSYDDQKELRDLAYTSFYESLKK